MKKPIGPHIPPDYSYSEVIAIQALAQGIADEEQQRIAMKWLIEKCCGTYDMSFYPGDDGERMTVFAEGKRFVGNQVIKLTRLNASSLARREGNAET